MRPFLAALVVVALIVGFVLGGVAFLVLGFSFSGCGSDQCSDGAFPFMIFFAVDYAAGPAALLVLVIMLLARKKPTWHWFLGAILLAPIVGVFLATLTTPIFAATSTNKFGVDFIDIIGVFIALWWWWTNPLYLALCSIASVVVVILMGLVKHAKSTAPS